MISFLLLIARLKDTLNSLSQHFSLEVCHYD